MADRGRRRCRKRFILAASVALTTLRIERHPNVCSVISASYGGDRQAKPREHYSGHGILLPIHRERAADDRPIAAQAIP
jgi:hypothetical protein